MAGRTLNSGPTSETVRHNVARLRRASDLTYADLSRELDRRGHPIPPLGLRRIEAGERRVDVDDLVALALSLDVNPNALLFHQEEGSQVPADLTGYVHHGRDRLSTKLTWEWARGSRSLSYRHAADGTPLTNAWFEGFRRRVQPREVMTDVERFDRRERWLRFEVSNRVEELEKAKEAERFDEAFDLELERLNKLDPTIDAMWVEEPFDPAPPSQFSGGHDG